MYLSLISWIKTTFLQTDPLASRNELLDAEILQILAKCRVKSAAEAEKLAGQSDTNYSVDSTTTRVTITLHDLTGSRISYGHDVDYWFHPDTFDVLVNDVVVDDHLYVFYPVSMDLEFVNPVVANSTVKIRGHILRAREVFQQTADQWLLKVSMLGNVKTDEFDQLARRFNQTVNRICGPHRIRR